jgi:cell division septation protein DedD
VQQEDSDSLAAPATADRRKDPMPLVWIPATLGVGLSIAAVYLGSRILSGHPAPPPAPTQTSVSVAVPPIALRPAESSSQTKAEAPRPADPQQTTAEAPPMIEPQPGEQYIQVSALGPEAAQRFSLELRAAKMEPHLAPGPTPEVLRVLIGPFVDQDALIETRRDLERAGIKNFVRRY